MQVHSVVLTPSHFPSFFAKIQYMNLELCCINKTAAAAAAAAGRLLADVPVVQFLASQNCLFAVHAIFESFFNFRKQPKRERRKRGGEEMGR